MRRTSCLFVVALAVLCTAAAEAAPLKVISWNLHHGQDIDGNNKVQAQAEWLSAQRPDILILPEVEQFSASYGNFDHVAYIKKTLEASSGRTYYAFWVNKSGAAKGNGQVVALLSVFPFTSTAAKALPHSRGLAMANVEVLPGRVIGLFGLHLASWKGYDNQRTTQIAELIYWLTTRGVTTRLIGGDWNLTPDSVPLAPMHYWYIDVYKKAKAAGVFSGPEATRPVYQADSVVGRIDALFLGKSWPSWMRLIEMEHVNTGLSDHYAVVADFEVQ